MTNVALNGFQIPDCTRSVELPKLPLLLFIIQSRRRSRQQITLLIPWRGLILIPLVCLTYLSLGSNTGKDLASDDSDGGHQLVQGNPLGSGSVLRFLLAPRLSNVSFQDSKEPDAIHLSSHRWKNCNRMIPSCYSLLDTSSWQSLTQFTLH